MGNQEKVSNTPARLLHGRSEAAVLLGLSTRTIDNAIRSGDLEARKVGRRVLISRDELIRFMDKQLL